jgi:phospholipid/cholesterol/gamma-HCH transport system substrate-binding protein
MNNAQMSARVGLFFLLGLALIWVTFETLGEGTLDAKNTYPLTAQFNSVKELKVGDEVRLAGVRVGRVAEIRLRQRRAEVVLQIARDVEVANDAVATIAMAGLLGANYVSLTLGTEAAGLVAPGDALTTVESGDLNALVTQLGGIGAKIEDALSQFTGAMSGEDDDNLFAKLDALIEDNREQVGAITRDLADVAAQIRRGEGTLGKLLYDDTAHAELVATLAEIRGAAAEARTFLGETQGLIAEVKRGEGAIGALLYDPHTADNLKVTLRNLREVSDRLNAGEGTLGKLLSDDRLFHEAQSTIQKVNRAIDAFADQGPITAVGAAASALF